MRLQFRYILIIVALCVFSTSLALGASVTITSSGAGSFSVQGENMKGLCGTDMTIGYDTSLLSAPTVSWGSLVAGALSIANTNVPGVIRIAIAGTTPFSESGPIAALTFGKLKGNRGITSVTVNKMLDCAMTEIKAQANISPEAAGTTITGSGLGTTSGVPFSQPDSPRVSTPAATPAAAAATPPLSGIGTVSMPGDSQPKGELQPAESKAVDHPPEAVDAAETVSSQINQPTEEKTIEKNEAVDVKQTMYSGVLDRFRTYQREKTPDILVALFTKAVSPFIRQEPAVAISDGKSIVRVTVDLSAIKGTSTHFALTGAKLVSMKKLDDAGIWLLEALPEMNSIKASVTILNSNSVIEFPLTVVPPSAAVSGKQAGFAEFLKDSGVKTPKHDLNGDGRHDYLDDFIYTAHYLSRTNLRPANM